MLDFTLPTHATLPTGPTFQSLLLSLMTLAVTLAVLIYQDKLQTFLRSEVLANHPFKYFALLGLNDAMPLYFASCKNKNLEGL